MLDLEGITIALERRLKGDKVQNITPRGKWLRDIYEVTFSSGAQAFLKVETTGEKMAAKEDYVGGLLRKDGLPSPNTLLLDTSGELLGAPAILQERVGGHKLGQLLSTAGNKERVEIYRALGRFYRKLHGIKGPSSGWIVGAGEVLPFSPNDFQHNQVIVRIGAEAVAKGQVGPEVYDELVRVMSSNLTYLKNHEPVLVTGGVLHWAVYLEADNEGYRVTKLMDLHDCLWWDRGWDLASIRYPVFMSINDDQWEAFLEGYGREVDTRRLKLYRLMQTLDACMGNYYEPKCDEHEQWRQEALRRLPKYIAEVSK